jgi:hypothetical protein
MVVERRIEVLGIPVRKKRVVPKGAPEVMDQMTLDAYDDGRFASTTYRTVFVDSIDSAIVNSGHYLPPERGSKLSQPVITSSVRYSKEAINNIDLEKRIFPGVKIVYKWRKTPKPTAEATS